MSNYEDRRYDRQNQDNNSSSRRDGRNDFRDNENRFDNQNSGASKSVSNYGNRRYNADNEHDRNDSNSRFRNQPENTDEGNYRNENGYDNRNSYGSEHDNGNERGNGNEGHGNENAYGRNRGYGSQYRDENYMDQHYSRNSGRDAQQASSRAGNNNGRNASSRFGDQNSRQSTRWEGKNDENYNDWTNGTKSRGLGRSETGNNFGESHRGKGPKNYTRSDSRIKEDISDALTDHHGIDASDIDIEISSGTVILKGTVDSRSAKRQAEDVIENVSGVNNVENRLHVKSQNSSHANSDNKNASNSNSDSNKSESQTEKSSSDANSRSGKISA